MRDINDYLALLRLVQAQRRTTRETLIEAAGYAIKIVICTALLLAVYHWIGGKSVMWAIVSAILVIQPGIEQSIQASAIRIAANLVGGGVGFGIGAVWGTFTAPMLVALVITVFVCEILRLDLGVRTACVATVIVMTSSVGTVSTSSLERLSTVLAGCVVAIVIQFTAEGIRRTFGRGGTPVESKEQSQEGE